MLGTNRKKSIIANKIQIKGNKKAEKIGHYCCLKIVEWCVWILVQDCGILKSKSWTEIHLQIKLSSQMCVSRKNLKIWVYICNIFISVSKSYFFCFVFFVFLKDVHIHRWYVHLQTHCRHCTAAPTAQLTSRSSVALLDQCNVSVRTVLRSVVKPLSNVSPLTPGEMRCSEVKWSFFRGGHEEMLDPH